MYNGFRSKVDKGIIDSKKISIEPDKKNDIEKRKIRFFRQNSDLSLKSDERIKKWVENNYNTIAQNEVYSDLSHVKH